MSTKQSSVLITALLELPSRLCTSKSFKLVFEAEDLSSPLGVKVYSFDILGVIDDCCFGCATPIKLNNIHQNKIKRSCGKYAMDKDSLQDHGNDLGVQSFLSGSKRY